MLARPWSRVSLAPRSEEHTSELQSPDHLACRLLRANKTRRGIPTAAAISSQIPSVSCREPAPRWNRWIFFFNDTATTEIYTLSLHDALPIWDRLAWSRLEIIFILTATVAGLAPS